MHIKWLKLHVDIFNDEKIKLIRKYPDGDKILVIWIWLLTMAMKSTDKGIIQLSDGIPYTDNDLSAIMEIEVKTIQMAIELFKRFNMLTETEGGTLEIINFRKHQSIAEIEYKQEKNRLKVANFRAKQKLLNVGNHVTVTPVTVTHREEKRREEKNRIDKIKKEKDITKKNITKKDKSLTKDKLVINIFPTNLDNIEFKNKWSEWGDYRAQSKKRLTDMTIKKQLKFLSSYTNVQAMDIIDRSIMNGWAGLFHPQKNNITKNENTGDRSKRLLGEIING